MLVTVYFLDFFFFIFLFIFLTYIIYERDYLMYHRRRRLERYKYERTDFFFILHFHSSEHETITLK